MRRIVQHPNVVAILNTGLTYRQIFTDGRELESDPLPTWTGYSVGRWDGDTLVVESNGYNDQTWLHARGLPHTERLRITERYRRPDFGHIRVDVTYEDTGSFDEPLTAVIEMEFVADDELLETVCNEASEGRSHWGGGISEAEERAVDVAPEILARYVGTYEGNWQAARTRVDVTLEDGALFLLRDPALCAKRDRRVREIEADSAVGDRVRVQLRPGVRFHGRRWGDGDGSCRGACFGRVALHARALSSDQAKTSPQETTLSKVAGVLNVRQSAAPVSLSHP